MARDPARWGERIVASPPASANPAQGPGVAGLGPVDGATGRFVIVWPQTIDVLSLGDSEGVVGQVFNGDGSRLGTPFLVNTTTYAVQAAPVVVDRDAGEGFVVGFADMSRPATGFGSDVRLRLFDGNGTPEGADFVINAGGPTEIFNQSQPSLARTSAFGTVLAAFTDLDQRSAAMGGEDRFDEGIRGRLFSNATPLGMDLLVNTTVLAR